MWSFLGSVLTASRWLNYTGTSQIYSHLHCTASQAQRRSQAFCFFSSSSSSRKKKKKTSHAFILLLGSRWYHFTVFIVTIPRNRPDVSHLDALTASRVPLAPSTVRFLCFFTAPATLLCLRWDRNLTFNSWCFKLWIWQPKLTKKNPKQNPKPSSWWH